MPHHINVRKERMTGARSGKRLLEATSRSGGLDGREQDWRGEEDVVNPVAWEGAEWETREGADTGAEWETLWQDGDATVRLLREGAAKKDVDVWDVLWEGEGATVRVSKDARAVAWALGEAEQGAGVSLVAPGIGVEDLDQRQTLRDAGRARQGQADHDIVQGKRRVLRVRGGGWCRETLHGSLADSLVARPRGGDRAIIGSRRGWCCTAGSSRGCARGGSGGLLQVSLRGGMEADADAPQSHRLNETGPRAIDDQAISLALGSNMSHSLLNATDSHIAKAVYAFGKRAMCRQEGCIRTASFGLVSNRRRLACSSHKAEGHVDLCMLKCVCRHEGCEVKFPTLVRKPAFGTFCLAPGHKGCMWLSCFAMLISFSSTCAADSILWARKRQSSAFLCEPQERSALEPQVEDVRCAGMQLTREMACQTRLVYAFNASFSAYWFSPAAGNLDERRLREVCFRLLIFVIQAIYGNMSSKHANVCNKHRSPGDLDLRSKRCKHDSCHKQPGSGRDYCASHLPTRFPAGDIDLVEEGSKGRRQCEEEGCMVRATYGTKRPRACSTHGRSGERDLVSKKCEVSESPRESCIVRGATQW